MQVGQRVMVKRRGLATITAEPPQDPAHPQSGRWLVTYEGGTGATYYARPETLKPLLYRVLVCETTGHYRAAALTYALPTDVVLEVGCHEGVTTDLLHHRCRWVMGIDKAWDPVARAREKYPHCQLEKMDGFDIKALRARSPTGSFDKVFIDIGGIAELHVVMSLLGLYFRAFRNTYIIVKSKYLKTLLRHTQVWVPLDRQYLPPAGAQRQQAQQAQAQQQQQQQAQPSSIAPQQAAANHPPSIRDQQQQQQQDQAQDAQGEAAGSDPPRPCEQLQDEDEQQQQQQQQQVEKPGEGKQPPVAQPLAGPPSLNEARSSSGTTTSSDTSMLQRRHLEG